MTGQFQPEVGRRAASRPWRQWDSVCRNNGMPMLMSRERTYHPGLLTINLSSWAADQRVSLADAANMSLLTIQFRGSKCTTVSYRMKNMIDTEYCINDGCTDHDNDYKVASKLIYNTNKIKYDYTVDHPTTFMTVSFWSRHHLPLVQADTDWYCPVVIVMVCVLHDYPLSAETVPSSV